MTICIEVQPNACWPDRPNYLLSSSGADESPAQVSGASPSDFLWGIATSAYQIEGSLHADGRGRSIWETFSAIPGAIERGENAAMACDHYRRFAEDVALIAALGVDSYRFSIAWPRIQPEGHGPPNPAGLAFQDRLVDQLLDRGIRPFSHAPRWRDATGLKITSDYNAILP